MAWDKGFNFRATSNYVTDSSPTETYVLGEQYGVTRNSVTFGWSVDLTANARDRVSGNDRRLAGLNFTTGTTNYFRVDLPAAGLYKIHVAMGDGGSTNWADWAIKDTTTTLFTTSGFLTNNTFSDATDTNYSAANWPASETGVIHNFATTELRVYSNGSSGNNVIAHLRIIQLNVHDAEGSLSFTGDATATTPEGIGFYSTSFVISGLDSPRTLMYLTATDNRVVEIVSASVTNSNTETNEQLEITFQRINSLGTPTAIRKIPFEHESNKEGKTIVHFNVTANEPTYSSNTQLAYAGASSLIGWFHRPCLEERIYVSGTSSIGLRLLSTPTSFDSVVKVVFRELG